MIEMTILGQAPSKSNCYGVKCFGSKGSMYKKAAVKKYERSFISQIPAKYLNKNIEYYMKVDIDCYYDSRRPDLDNSAKVILDCLQAAGVIKNDNKVYELNMTKNVRSGGSRVDIRISESSLGT